MAGVFDVTFKQLIDEYAVDWVRLFAGPCGLPPDVVADPLDVDLTAVQVQADRVFQLRPPAVGLLHLEPQSSRDAELPDRLLEYNVLLHRRYGGPVYSVALLLRPEADAPGLTGILTRQYPAGDEYHRFRYWVVRVWELSQDQLFAAGVGLSPLVVLSHEAAADLRGSVSRLDAQLASARVTTSARQLLVMCAYLIAGLRYDDEQIHRAFMGILNMKDSSTYQAILREGRQEGIRLGREEGRQLGIQEGINEGRQAGRQEGLNEGRQEGQLLTSRQVLLDLLRERFQTLSPDLEHRIHSTTDLARLQAAVRQCLKVSSPDELQL